MAQHSLDFSFTNEQNGVKYTIKPHQYNVTRLVVLMKDGYLKDEMNRTFKVSTCTHVEKNQQKQIDEIDKISTIPESVKEAIKQDLKKLCANQYWALMKAFDKKTREFNGVEKKAIESVITVYLKRKREIEKIQKQEAEEFNNYVSNDKIEFRDILQNENVITH